MLNASRRPWTGIRRAIRSAFVVVFFAAICVGLSNAAFTGLPRGCRHHYRAAWGFSQARDAGLKALQRSSKCPSNVKISVAGRSAQIAANLFGDPSDECQDTELNLSVEHVCGSEWRTIFKSNSWHSHRDGTRYLPERHWYWYMVGTFFLLPPLILSVITK